MATRIRDKTIIRVYKCPYCVHDTNDSSNFRRHLQARHADQPTIKPIDALKTVKRPELSIAELEEKYNNLKTCVRSFIETFGAANPLINNLKYGVAHHYDTPILADSLPFSDADVAAPPSYATPYAPEINTVTLEFDGPPVVQNPIVENASFQEPRNPVRKATVIKTEHHRLRDLINKVNNNTSYEDIVTSISYHDLSNSELNQFESSVFHNILQWLNAVTAAQKSRLETQLLTQLEHLEA